MGLEWWQWAAVAPFVVFGMAFLVLLVARLIGFGLASGRHRFEQHLKRKGR